MSNEFLMEVLFIKIKVNGYIENITENTKEIIDTNAIKNKNKISYLIEDTKNTITFFENYILLLRDNQEFTHKLVFKLNKQTKSEYYIKEYSSSIDVNILTTNIEKTQKNLLIEYKVIDTDESYRYIIEMSEKV